MNLISFNINNYVISMFYNPTLQNSIYMNLINKTNNKTYNCNVSSNDLKTNIKLSEAHNIIINCLNNINPHTYTYKIKLINNQIQMSFNAVFDGFLNISFNMCLSETVSEPVYYPTEPVSESLIKISDKEDLIKISKGNRYFLDIDNLIQSDLDNLSMSQKSQIYGIDVRDNMNIHSLNDLVNLEKLIASGENCDISDEKTIKCVNIIELDISYNNMFKSLNHLPKLEKLIAIKTFFFPYLEKNWSYNTSKCINIKALKLSSKTIIKSVEHMTKLEKLCACSCIPGLERTSPYAYENMCGFDNMGVSKCPIIKQLCISYYQPNKEVQPTNKVQPTNPTKSNPGSFSWYTPDNVYGYAYLNQNHNYNSIEIENKSDQRLQSASDLFPESNFLLIPNIEMKILNYSQDLRSSNIGYYNKYYLNIKDIEQSDIDDMDPRFKLSIYGIDISCSHNITSLNDLVNLQILKCNTVLKFPIKSGFYRKFKKY